MCTQLSFTLTQLSAQRTTIVPRQHPHAKCRYDLLAQFGALIAMDAITR
jgi:hypothetical protein